MEEHVYKLEEFHRGKWQPLISDKGKQKIAKITDEQAEIMNRKSIYTNIKYVKDSVKEVSNKKVDTSDDLTALRAEYEEKMGKKPFGAWDAEKIKQKMAKA